MSHMQPIGSSECDHMTLTWANHWIQCHSLVSRFAARHLSSTVRDVAGQSTSNGLSGEMAFIQ